MFHYFKGRSLTHLGCALGICVGLMAGLVLGGILSSHAAPLGTALWVLLGVTVVLGAAGWALGAALSPRPEGDGSAKPPE